MRVWLWGYLILALLLTGCLTGKPTTAPAATAVSHTAEVHAMKLTSPDFAHGGTIPAKFTCDGQNVSPGLSWSNVPAQAQSLALVCEDPDAPSGTFIHWIVINLPVATTGIPTAGPLPAGAVCVANDFGTTAYGGPCPPNGIHRYFFRLYALDASSLPTVTRKNLAGELKKHTLEQVEIMARYGRPK